MCVCVCVCACACVCVCACVFVRVCACVFVRALLVYMGVLIVLALRLRLSVVGFVSCFPPSLYRRVAGGGDAGLS